MKLNQEIKDKIFDMYVNERKSGSIITKELGIQRYLVYELIKEQGIARSNSEKSKKYFCNSHYFDTIDNEHKAYWMGFIAADGYIRSQAKYNNRALGICLAQKDREHLEKFKVDIGATNPILDFEEKNFHTITSRIIITDSNICNALEKHGVLEHKSLVLEFPTEKELPYEFINAFVRGYFDGDGSISVSEDGIYTASLLGTYEFLSKIKEIYGFDGKISQKNGCTTNNYYIRVGGSYKPYAFLNQIYKDATTYLDRKYEKYLNLQNKIFNKVVHDSDVVNY